MLSGCWRRRSQLCERSCWTPAVWNALCCPLASLRCSVPRPFCLLSPDFAVSIWCDLQIALFAPTSNVGVNLFFQCILLNFCCANVPQSLSVVVARRFGSFTTSTEGRSIAPLCRRQFLSLVTDLTLFLLSFSTLLETRRLSPVHLSYFLYFI